jgi:hypothetical protein
MASSAFVAALGPGCLGQTLFPPDTSGAPPPDQACCDLTGGVELKARSPALAVDSPESDFFDLTQWGKDNMLDWAKQHYTHRGPWWVRNGSHLVRWDRVPPASP